MFNKITDQFSPIDLAEMRFTGFLDKRATEIEQCVNNVLKGKGVKPVLQCPICQCPDHDILFNRFGIDIVQCQQCSCGFPAAFPIDTADVYRNDDYLPIAQSDYLDNVDYRKQRFASERLTLINDHCDNSPTESRLLDVGCGTGWFLEMAAKRGYSVSGQEFGRELGEFTSKRLGIDVWTDCLTMLPGEDQYDVITIFDVIEHVPNPREVMASINRLLKPGGITILFTPNLDSYGFHCLKEQSSLVMPTEHLFYFTAKSFEILISEMPFHIEYMATKGMDIADLYSYQKDSLKNSHVALFLEEHFNELQAMIDAAKCANHMRYILRKTK